MTPPAAAAVGDLVRVLLVEDDPADAHLLRAALAARATPRLDITHVTTLADAIAQVGRTPGPEVVLLDLSLPDSAGPATLQQLLATRSPVPIVVLTGLDDDRTAAEAIEAGAQDYLVKGSVTGDVMARAMRHAMERHRLQETLRERVKEMTGLFAIGSVLQQDGATSQTCERVAGHLVAAMQRPEICHVLVVVDGTAATAGPRAPVGSPERLTAVITVDGRERGRITVGYTEPERPFLLPEEQQLIDSAADAMGGWLARRDAQQELVHDKERLRLLVSQLPGAVWTTDTDLRVTSVAGAMLTEPSVDGPSMVGAPVDTLMESVGDDRLAPFEAAMAGDSVVFERAWKGRWWRNHVGPRRDASGTIVGTVCLTLDITAEQDQQVELDAARERFQGLFANATDAMILADDDGVYIDANPAACTLTGYDYDELLGMSAWGLAATTDVDGSPPVDAAAKWEHFLAAGDLAGEYASRRRDGRTVEVEYRRVANIVPGVHLSTLRDITDRKRTERALAASETRFRTMAESAQDAIYRLRLEPELAFDYLNAAAESISGYPRQAFYDNPLLYRERAHPDDTDELDRVRVSPERTSTVTVRFQRADGSWIWLEDRRTAVIEDGHITGVQGIIRDITAREQTEQALRGALHSEQQAAERLRAIDELKSGFLQAVSHELRTPLTSVLGYARTLDGRADQLTPDQIRDFHHRLSVNATRLDGLLTDLLDVERLNRGVIRLDLQPTDLGALAAHVASTIEFGDRTCLIDDGSAVAVVDTRKVERILHNLLVNATKHTPADATVWVACRADDETATITVSDNGPGILASDRDHAFEPFWQGSEMRSVASPGTGIGLSLVRQFATLHGGRAWVDERPGGGASFHLSLPTSRPTTEHPNKPIVFPASPSERDGELSFFEIMQDTVNTLDTATEPGQAAGIILAFLERVGAQLTDATHPDAIDIDVGLDTPQPLRPAAPIGAPGRRRLENHLPFLVDHARRSLTRNAPRAQPLGDADIDPTTGILRPRALDRLLNHLHGHDAVAVITLQGADGDHPDGPMATMQRLTRLARQLSRDGDHVVLTGPHELVLVLPDTPEDRATAVINRLRTVWTADPANPGQPIGATVAVETGAARQALERARTLARTRSARQPTTGQPPDPAGPTAVPATDPA